MTDFSGTHIHCSALYYIMSNGRDKMTPKQKWINAVDELAKVEEEYERMFVSSGRTHLKTAAKKQEKIEKLRACVIELDLHKDDEFISEGCKSYLTSIYAYEKYHKWSAAKDRGTKYTNKGVMVEEDSIDLISKLDRKMYVKNEETLENEFLRGTPDVIVGEEILHADYVIDVKSSWDVDTFFSNLSKGLIDQYWWQIQGYMALTGSKIGEVSFCLVNTPQALINDEAFKLFRRMDCVTDQNPAYLQAEEELINNLTFDDIPEEERRIKFIVERDDAELERAYKRVALCREYLSEIESLHLSGDFAQNSLYLQENNAE